MEINHVEGNTKGEIILYAISTCVWCKKVKKLLNSLNADYYYIDVDLLDGREREKVEEEVTKWNPLCSFPTLVIDNKESVVGYDEEEIKRKIKSG